MKKIISLVLVLMLCMALVACGTDEKYAALLEHLEANNYEGIKSELAALSPDFQAEQEQMAADAEKLAKYEDLIDLLEAEDYESAMLNVQERIPVPVEPSCSAIAITLDNWQEYYVIEHVEKWHTNSFGETDALSFDVTVCLKPEYADRVANKEDSKTNFDISYDCICRTIDIDYSAQTYTFTDYYSEQQTFQNIGTWNNFALGNPRSVICTHLGSGTINDIPCVSYFENVTVNRIEGTLYLYDE